MSGEQVPSSYTTKYTLFIFQGCIFVIYLLFYVIYGKN